MSRPTDIPRPLGVHEAEAMRAVVIEGHDFARPPVKFDNGKQYACARCNVVRVTPRNPKLTVYYLVGARVQRDVPACPPIALDSDD